ncbi:MAG: IS5 family transposase [Lentisphaeria bacterium]|nr:MAG: IS5 family transposase [Lentisphaeria bacterium]
MATTRLRTWEITDEFWAKVETYIPNDLRCPGVNYRRKPGGGRKSRYGNRLYFSAIVYVLRTGIIWNALPRKEFENITSQAVHKKFMQWSRAGFFQKLWHAGLMEYDEMEGIAWEWQSADGSHGKAPLAQELAGANPTDRGKKGSKKNLLVDAVGIPLSIVVTGANRHDAAVLDELLKERMKPLDFEHYKHITQNVCLDAGYVGKADVASRHGMVPHIRPRGEEKKAIELHGFRPKRWIVEVAHSWFNRFRKIHVRYEKTACAYNALLYLAAMMITMNKIMAIYPPL